MLNFDWDFRDEGNGSLVLKDWVGRNRNFHVKVIRMVYVEKGSLKVTRETWIG